MSDRWIFESVSLLGLVTAVTAVCDMLLVWKLIWLQSAFIIYGVALLVSLALLLLIKKANAHVMEICRNKPRLLPLRLVAALGLFLLAWYINAAMTAIYGKDSVEVAYNGARVLAVTATLMAHVVYLGFARRAQKN